MIRRAVLRAAARLPWLAALAAVVAIALLATREARAFTTVGGRWPYTSLPVSYAMNLASAPASIGSDGARAAVEAGFATWAGPACTQWRATRNTAGTTLTRAVPGDRQNSVLWISGSWPAELGDVNTVIGVTTPLIGTGTMRIFEADMQFNAVGFRWSLTGAAGTVDTQSIATHEEGHFLGLGHTPVSAAIMFASYSGGIKRTLNADDQSGVCTLYPVGATEADAGTPGGVTPLGGTCGASFPPCEPGAGCACAGTDCICTRPCSGTMPCPTGFMCIRTSSTQSLCLAPGTGTIGSSCVNGLDCRSLMCLRDATTGTGFCTDRCMDDCGCPAGYTCGLVGGAGACTRGDNACPTVDAGPGDDSGMTTDPDADTTPDAPAAVGDGGDGGRAMDGSADGGGAPGRRAGCGCSVPAGTSRHAGLLGAMLAVAALAAVRRARRRRRDW